MTLMYYFCIYCSDGAVLFNRLGVISVLTSSVVFARARWLFIYYDAGRSYRGDYDSQTFTVYRSIRSLSSLLQVSKTEKIERMKNPWSWRTSVTSMTMLLTSSDPEIFLTIAHEHVNVDREGAREHASKFGRRVRNVVETAYTV